MEAGPPEWRERVREALRRRESGAEGLRALLERHERLRERWEQAQRRPTGENQEEEEEEEGGPGRGPSSSSSSSLRPRLRLLQREAAELRREKEELRQEASFLRELLRRREAEDREQRARMGRLAQEAASLGHQFEEAQSKAWLLSQEAEGLRTELEGARGLLEEARRDRLDLEAQWLEEKAQEARRLNRANEQQEKYRQKVARLQEKLERMREAAGLGAGTGAEMAEKERGFNTECEEAGMGTGRQAEPNFTSPVPPQEKAEALFPREAGNS